MKTDFKNLSVWEAAMISWSVVGVILIGIVSFYSLTPEKRFQVKKAFDIFDIRQDVIEAKDTISFILDIPNEFYEEFYIAFGQIATIPAESFEFPTTVAARLYGNTKTAVNILTDQASRGYVARAEFRIALSATREIAYDGKVMGVAIETADKISKITITPKTPYTEVLRIPYSYTKPKVEITRRMKFYEKN